MNTPNEAPPANAAERPRWGRAGWLVVAAAFAVGFINFPLQIVGTGFEYLPGDDIDNPLNNFVLEHGYRYFTGRADSFWSAPAFYPQPLVTAWSDAHIGMLPLYSALRAGGFSPERAFQGHFLSCFLLNYAAAAWALKRLGFGAFAGAAGAYLFAFGLPLVAQVVHTQLFPRCLVPPAVAFAWEYLRMPRGWHLGAVAACAVGQVYLSVYIGYFLGLLLATGFVVSAARFRRQLPWSELFPRSRREWKRRALMGAVAAVALLPLAVGHARGGSPPGREQVRLLAPRPRSWLSPPAAAFASQLGDARSAVGEWQLTPGLVALAALAVALTLVVKPGAFGGPRATAAVGAVATLFLALVVTRFDGVWLYAPVAHVPGAGSIRAAGRVVLVLLFPAGIAVAWCVDALVARTRHLGSVPMSLAGALAVALVAADNWLAAPDAAPAAWTEMRYPLDHIRARQQRIADAIRTHPAPTLVYVFPSAAENKRLSSLVVQLEAMRAAQDLGLPCANGWSGSVPRGWDQFAGYRELMEWLTVTHAVAPDVLAGLVVVGEPVPDADPEYEAAMRAKFPPARLK